METNVKNDREIAESYLSSLVDLTNNSKPLINMLTMLAEENVEYGQTIVDAVEQRIAKVEPDLKLPILYLIDSIVKNVAGVYIKYFSQSIVKIFVGVFEQVNEDIRKKMFALRQTWNDVFPPAKLYTLDVKVNAIDPHWPILTQKISPSIHVNPNFFSTTTEKDIQTELQIKQRELLELKKRKLELELAATQKQLGMTTPAVPQQAQPVIVDPAKMMNPNELLKREQMQPNVPLVPKPVIIPQPAFIPTQIPPPNLRPKIGPVNPTLLNSVRTRDPRLMRQPPPAVPIPPSVITQSINEHIQQKLPPMGPIPRINNTHFAVNANRGRVQQMNAMPYNDASMKSHINNSNNTIGIDGKELNKRKNSRSPNKLPSKSMSKSDSNNGSFKSKSSSSKGSSSSSKNDRNSRSSSNSSSSKKSKSRKDDKSPQRKKSSSRHRSPTSSRRSSSPADSQKSSRKSSYDNKSKSSDSKHSKEKNCDNHSSSNSSKSSPSNSSNKSRNRSSRSKSPITVMKATDSIAKDIDLRAHLPPPIGLTNSLISSTIIDQGLIPSNVTTSVPISANVTIADRKTNINSDIRDKKFIGDTPKDVDFRVGLMPNMGGNQSGVVNASANIINDTKKRVSEESDLNEPKTKKTKSEKIDILFGKEDVDLRIAPLNQITPSTLPVPVATVLSTELGLNESPDLKPSNLKSEDLVPNVTKVSQDIDLRLRNDVNENSQESNDKFKIILMQAQEQIENSDLDNEQIQSMFQQMIKIKSDSGSRKTFKRNVVGKAGKVGNNDENVEAFSSGSDDENLKKSHRVPSKRRRQEKETPQSNTSTAHGTNDNNTKPPVVETIVPLPKERKKERKTKWNSPWEDQVKPPVLPMQTMPTNLIPTMPFSQLRKTQPPALAPDNDAMRNVRQFSSRNVPESVWQPNVMPFNGPPINPLAMLNNPGIPNNLMGNGQIVMAQHGPSLAPCTAKDRTINIDGIPREIRFYDETAIAFMEPNGREPKEIGFQSGERRVCVDNNESIVLAFNDTYKPFVINNKQYQIRFGTPTRELYIDNEWYECYFGDPAVGIVLNSKLHSFRIDGPAPQVRIGNMRNDLVVGKVDMFVDTQTKISLFLDAQLRMFQLNNQMHTIQFADYFLTVIIDNIPFPVQYGAMPVKFQLANSEHYIRFSVLPNNIVPGEIYVRNMKRTHLQRDLVSPTPMSNMNLLQSAAAMPVSIPPVTGPILPLLSMVPDIAGPNSTSVIGNQPASSSQSVPVISESSNPPSSLASLDINDLYQKLLATGIINKQKDKSPNKEKDKPSPVVLSKPETLKKRQPTIINALFSGMQCCNCGIRFPPEQTNKYSNHLDWHYRQNRRERDSARRAQSRKWYYTVADWIQYEEIENVDEREKNFFETQQTEVDSANEESNQRTASPPPSCIAGPDDHNKICDMCHDPFETFYNEETEEWHLRNAIRVEENIYHPICYEDYKASLTLDESHMNASSIGDMDDNAVDMQMKSEVDPSSIGLTNSANDRIPILDDDDDVIVLPQEELIITEIPDDDEPKESSYTSNNNRESEEKSSKMDVDSSGQEENANINEEDDAIKHNESDVQILEPQISVLNLDEYEETALDETQQPLVTKIKEEPKYEGYEDDEDDGFEDVGQTFEADPAEVLEEVSVEDSTPLPTIQTQPTPIASLDGNIEIQEAQPVSIGTNKIIINISTNVQLNKNSINSSESVDNNLAINNKETTDAQSQSSVINKSVVANDNGSSDANSTNLTSDQNASDAVSSNAAASEETEIEYEVKDSIKHVQFKRQPVFPSGLETSGLCSIM